MITYGPGFNAAEKIAEDLGIKKWCLNRVA